MAIVHNARKMPPTNRLPPLTEEYRMSINRVLNSVNYDDSSERPERKLSVPLSSDPNTSTPLIDCVLVFDRENKDEHNNNNNNNRPVMRPDERRRRFEDYLKKQNLVLELSTSEKFGYVTVHTPFSVLLSTAENMRMRLPIEKIDKDDNNSSELNPTCWKRFTERLKKPFRLDPILAKSDPDYYRTIYSRNINKFDALFDTFRGSRESYFTMSERSLLTYELLTRAHCNEDVIDHQQGPVAMLRDLNTVQGLQTGSKRPGIDRLITKKAYLRYFPLHESLQANVSHVNDDKLNDREKLRKYWATMRRCLQFQPLHLIRSYMGEKVALYFALAGFYNQMLIAPALVGLIVFIYGAASVFTDEPTSDICGDYGHSVYMCPRCDKICPFWQLSDSCLYSKISYVFDNVATFVFAILMSLWARLFVEFWKRRQAVLKCEWDSIDFEANLEPIRPAYENKANKLLEKKRINPVTELEEPYISNRKRVPFFFIAAAVVFITMVIVCATVFATIVYRVQMDYMLKSTPLKTYSSIIITVTSAVINLICSLILSQFYYRIAQKLTELELHKYQSKHDDSLIIKIYLFQFVNFYSSLFYIAFFKGRAREYPSNYGEPTSGDFTEQCDPAGCLVELSIQLVIVMTGIQIINTLFQFVTATYRECKNLFFSSDKNVEKKRWEIDNDLLDFNSNVLINEYLDLIIQFGFVTLFVVAFPLAPLFALLNNLIDLRLDAWKFLSKHKRPIPFKASDIGTWGDIISAVSYFAVLTNAAVIAWTSEFIPKMTYRTLQSTGTSLHGYVNWTLSSFPIADYNRTGTMPTSIPTGLTYCRYRDFRESTGPSYSETSIYWNVIAARLAFIVVFEHVIFFIVYLIQRLVPDVPKRIKTKIDHERYIDQRERWASGANNNHFKDATIASVALLRMTKDTNTNTNSPARTRKRKKRIGAKISPAD